MALSKAQKDMASQDYDPRIGGPVTEEAPAKDDQVAAVTGDASHEDSPVRTSRPDVPIATVMAGGVGRHLPPDPEIYDEMGRYRGPVKVADNTPDADKK